ncbi:hypothetical protein [Acetobacter orleanensis]|uniref:Uncharacterized protein n=1 Tax=Acetobacter orleanensis TaxID=104099 RepID=A0A4Y3TPW5_9PROT|nr:hypothetical protein [Acetobacter orleanensis]KXV66341.1 hypothetical protein AD949_02850 [Acetobacter orleanensis]PCD78552.1 hypothetical protein CO710_11760 [Acetobacter orleanensis]GAN69186.1 hypothetical protein Abol_027_038 [Acetobacter orleanensis JCM 7639]GBR29331.1 hypothetical protein AA0473_1986 [Acetobacter orleanensis NRIC 0473]GEB83773.1 hypothetical protein AOR01nite_22500 [Acetobacter orleanensis]
MRKLIMMLGVATGLLGITGGAGAAPRPYNAVTNAPAPQGSVTEAGGPLLSGYEQDGLILQDDLKNQTLVISADPATLRASALPSDGNNRYRVAMRDVLSAAASYAYLYFGQHADADHLSVVANIQSDGLQQASIAGGTTEAEQPAMTFDIPRPSFPISPDATPDDYSAKTISTILGGIDPAKTNIAPWLRNGLQNNHAGSGATHTQ